MEVLWKGTASIGTGREFRKVVTVVRTKKQ
jgi:hypothetical protein